MKKQLTVVVPAYNAQNYIRKTLDSLCVETTLEDVEVIVVDDGSTDQTGVIADQYQSRYPNTVVVIHKANGGHGSGVNCGICYASGRYFKVVDADDWVDETAFTNLVSYLRETDDDAVISGFYWAYDNGSGREETFVRKAEIEEPFPQVQYRTRYRFDEVAEKLYLKMHGFTLKTAILKEYQIKLDEHCFYVDTEFILYPIPYIETISFLPDYVYQYRIGRQGQSVSPQQMTRCKGDYDRVLTALLRFYESCRENCTAEKQHYIESIIARIVAGKIKVLLSSPAEAARKKELVDFDHFLKQQYSPIYCANRNQAVKVLRLSHYRLYSLAVAALCAQTRFTAVTWNRTHRRN